MFEVQSPVLRAPWMPSKKASKGRGGESRRRRFWRKTNWREIFWEIRHPSNPEEEDEADEKLPPLNSPGPVKRAKSDSEHSAADAKESRLRVYLLTELATLVNEVEAGSFVILDIDETILMTRGSPSLLLTKPGIDAFRAFVHKRVSDWKLKNDLCQHLQKALKDKVPVTPTTAATIQALQANGVLVCGLTARYSELAKVTEKELESIGVRLGLASPFPACLEDADLRLTVHNGVIYCNNQDKGVVLKEVLERFLFGEVLKRGRTSALLKSAKGDPMLVDPQHSMLQGSVVPPEIVFVDDVYINAASVCKNLASLADELDIDLSCYHYAPQERELCIQQLSVEGLDENSVEYRILLKQVETFFDNQTVLSNEQARLLL